MAKLCACNVAINELLCFLQNKCDVLDEISIIRLCISSFKSEDVDKAKTLLFEFVPTEMGRKITRKGENKTEKDLQDIIKVLKECEPKIFPKFVACDLTKLPPISFDHIDVSKFLTDIRVMQEELNTVKQQILNKCDEQTLKLNIEELRSEFYQKNIVNNAQNPLVSSNDERARGVNELQLPASLVARRSELTRTSDESEKEIFVPHAYTSEPALMPTNANANPTYASRAAAVPKRPVSLPSKLINKQIVEYSNNNNDDANEWIDVVHKKKRNKYQGNIGIASGISNAFKSADVKIPLYISNVDKSTNIQDISEYIKGKTQEKVTVEKISMKLEKPYCSYKVFVSRSKLDLYLNNNIWPEGIMFRRFVEYKKRQGDSNWYQNSQKETTSSNNGLL